jgi:hypothetical protein
LLVLLIDLLHAVPADPYSIIVGELGDLDEVLRAVLADSCPTLPTVVLSLNEAEGCLANEAV